MLLVMILLFSAVTSIPHAVVLSTSLLLQSWSSPLLPLKRSMSSANHRLHKDLPSTEMYVWPSWSVSCMIFSRNKFNRKDESKYPWWTTVAAYSTMNCIHTLADSRVTHCPGTVWELIRKTSSRATCLETFSHCCLSSLSHCGLILTLIVELGCAS